MSHSKHRPGYDARRRRIERFVLQRFKATRLDEYEQAWREGEKERG